MRVIGSLDSLGRTGGHTGTSYLGRNIPLSPSPATRIGKNIIKYWIWKKNCSINFGEWGYFFKNSSIRSKMNFPSEKCLLKRRANWTRGGGRFNLERRQHEISPTSILSPLSEQLIWKKNIHIQIRKNSTEYLLSWIVNIANNR